MHEEAESFNKIDITRRFKIYDDSLKQKAFQDNIRIHKSIPNRSFGWYILQYFDIEISGRHDKTHFKQRVPEEAYLEIVNHLLIVSNMSIHSSHIFLQTMTTKVSISKLSVLLSCLTGSEQLNTAPQIPDLKRFSSHSRLPENSAIDNEGITT